ncbi:TPA: hypothetical protein U3Q61_001426 [Streptococcus agalactiae]|nr:hypothetical protein [Streptococcus agalactiae]
MLVKNGEPFIQLDKEKKWFWHLDPMGQVSGPRSSGKTFFLYYLMLSVAEIGADIYILDPKRSDFSSLKYCYPEAEKGVGKGYIYLDGQGWQTPKAFIAPYMDSSKMDIKQIFKNLLNNPPKVYKE